MPDEQRLIPIPQLKVSRWQPRRDLDEETLGSIRAAIKNNGGAFPMDMAITVRQKGEEAFEILSGHHRVAAADEAGCGGVWAVVKANVSDQEAAVMVSASNQHTRLSPLEHGEHICKLMEKFGITTDQYVGATGLNRQTVYNYVWAWRVLESVGGWASKHRVNSCAVLSALHGLKEPSRRAAVLDALTEAALPQVHALDVIRNVREGMGIPEAIAGMEVFINRRRLERRGELSMGHVRRPAPRDDDPMVAPSGLKVSNASLDATARTPGKFAHKKAKAVAGEMRAAADQQNDYIKALEWNVAMLMARQEALERTIGTERLHRSRTAMVREVQKRIPEILAEMRATNTMPLLAAEGEAWA